MSNSMISPSINELKKLTGDRYSLVVITAQRARQLIDGELPLIKTTDKKALTIAIKELEAGVLKYDVLDDTML